VVIAQKKLWRCNAACSRVHLCSKDQDIGIVFAYYGAIGAGDAYPEEGGRERMVGEVGESNGRSERHEH